MTGLFEYGYLALPEMVVIITACLVLLFDVFSNQRQHPWLLALASTGLFIAALASYFYAGQSAQVIWGGLLISDDWGHVMNFSIALVMIFCLFYAKGYLVDYDLPQGDFYALTLFATAGMMILVSSNNLITLYLGIELLSLPSYALTALARENGDGAEAGMKYFVMGSVASALLLYGMSLLYGATGHLELPEIANAIATDPNSHKHLLVCALVFIVAAIGFKLALVPFHMWAPDVYQGAPHPVTMFIGSAPKIASVAMVLRLLTYGLVGLVHDWQLLLILMALLSTGIGNLLALKQTNLKRMLAYSTISHMGYAVFGIIAATPAGFSAALYYAIVYALTSVGGFGLLVLLSRKDHEISDIADLSGLSKRNPWAAFLMMIIMLSMAGIPPTVGFLTKLLVLKALVDVNLLWVAVLGLLFAVMGAFYYLRIIKTMYFDEPTCDSLLPLPSQTQVLFSINALSLLYLGLFPSALVTVCVNAFAV